MESSTGCSRRYAPRVSRFLTMSGLLEVQYIMAKLNKAPSTTATAVRSDLESAIVSALDKVAASAVETQIGITNTTESFRADFRDLCFLTNVPTVKRDGLEVFDRESEVGKKLTESLRAKVTEQVKARDHYSIPVYRVGAEDKYLPVRVWSSLRSKWCPVDVEGNVVDPDKVKSHGVALREPNHTFTAAFALGADLKDYPSVAESPSGVKAWLRGTASGERPDGKSTGMRDWVKNEIDQSISRGWKTPAVARVGGAKQDLHDLLKGLYKAGKRKRDKHEKDGERVVSDDQWKALCEFVAEAAFNPDMLEEYGIGE